MVILSPLKDCSIGSTLKPR